MRNNKLNAFLEELSKLCNKHEVILESEICKLVLNVGEDSAHIGIRDNTIPIEYIKDTRGITKENNTVITHRYK